jgi:alpha-glucosidase
MAMFGGSAWAWEPRTEQFYLHSFLPEQPDLNWRNPEVRDAMWDMMRYWLEMGVDGFRLDVINWFIKDADLRDNPTRLLGPRPYDRQDHVYDRDRPETLELVKELRRIVDEYPGRMTVGEVGLEPPGDPALPARYYGNGQGLHMAFNFAFLYCPWRAKSFRRAIERWESLLGESDADLWPNYTLSNHDQSRAFSRYGESEARARVAAALLLTLRGTPFIYYGEEIGMRDGWIPPWRIQDPPGKKYWPLYQGRDPVRTPMQWSDDINAGFSSGNPWLPVNSDYRKVNVERQRHDPTSLYSWYRRLIRVRKQHDALHRGSLRIVPQRSDDVLCYLREHEDQRVVVALSFSRRRREIVLPAHARWRRILSSDPDAPETTAGRQRWLAPNSALIVEALDLPHD